MNNGISRFIRHKPAVIGLILLMLVILAAALAGVLAPADPFALVGKPFQPFRRTRPGNRHVGP